MTAEIDAIDSQATPTPQPARTWQRRVLSATRVLFTLAIVAAIAYATATQWRAVKQYFFSLAWESVALSLVMVLVGLAAATFGWRAALADVGHRVSVRTAGHVYLVGLFAKYLPGSVWAFVLQMELGRRENLPRSRAFLASIVLTGIGTTVALCLGVFGLSALRDVGGGVKVLLLILVPVSIVCAHPRVLTWLVQRFLAIVRRPPLETPITWRGVGAVAFWSLISWIALGIHLWLLANSEAAPGFGGVFRCIGAIALGMTAGFFAFLAPSGLGVREAIIVAALLPYLPGSVALSMALASRMLFVIADLVAGGIALLSLLRSRRRAAVAA